MKVVKSSQLKNDKICRNGFSYTLNRKIGHKYYWMCDLNRAMNCKGRLVTELNYEGNYIITKSTLHSHLPSVHRSSVVQAKNDLRNLAKSAFNASPMHIVDKVNQSDIVRNNDLNSFMGSENSQLKMVKRVQNNQLNCKFPPSPKDLDFVYDLTFNHLYINNEQILLFDLLSQDKQKRFSIFTTDELIRVFCEAELIVIDGTFQTTPKPFYQLLIIHGNLPSFENYFTHPLIYVLMSGKDKILYTEVFKEIKNYATSLGLTIKAKFSMSDYELGIRAAINSVLPSVDKRACFFHTRQITIKRLKKLKLFNLYRTNAPFAKEINLIMALAFFPPNDIEELFNIIYENGSDEACLFYDWFAPIYIRKFDGSEAINSPRFWSVYDLVMQGLPKTQCGAEQSHHSLFLACNRYRHLPLYRFISIINGQMIKSQQKIERILNGIYEKKSCKIREKQEAIIRNILMQKDNPQRPLYNSLKGVATALTHCIHLLENLSAS